MNPAHVGKFMTGARPSPRHVLLRARPHRILTETPAQAGWFPKQLDMWGNDQFGDCVSAEEAFAKACYSPEIFIPTQTVTDWARKNGYLNGADLSSVMQSMQSGGFVLGSQTYDDGPPSGVDYTNEAVLQNAISQGPVKIAIAADCLPSGAGNQMGWYDISATNNNNTDHCVSLCAYGTADWIFAQLNTVYGNVPLPPQLAGQQGYGLYTWKTIGFVSIAWIKGTCSEAWVRNPTTVGVPPLTPTPPPPPPPATISLEDCQGWVADGINAWSHKTMSKAEAVACASAGLAASWPS